ncbi:UNVERIFIED_CONTAM: hypothetical protein NY603_29290, partial [Bacteroidetes bacterium 56_B9]
GYTVLQISTSSEQQCGAMSKIEVLVISSAKQKQTNSTRVGFSISVCQNNLILRHDSALAINIFLL